MSGFKVVTAHAIEARSRATDLHIGFGGHILLGGLLPVTAWDHQTPAHLEGQGAKPFRRCFLRRESSMGPAGRRIGR